MTEQEYVSYRDKLHAALATLLEPHHAGVVIDVAADLVLTCAASEAAAGNMKLLSAIEETCAAIRGNAAKAAE